MKQLFTIFILLMLVACSSEPYIVKPTKNNASFESVDIYVVSHGWHTGLVLPVGQINKRIPALKERFPDAPYIEFGWGDKGFYQAEEISVWLAVKAIFWPTESVIHAVAVSDDVERYFNNSQVEKICLSRGGLSSLLAFVARSFYKDGESNVSELERGIYGNSQFYQGVGDYYLMNTCNKWTAKGLKSAGLAISPAFKLTADSVMDSVGSYTCG